jgi:hypothetical protein
MDDDEAAAAGRAALFFMALFLVSVIVLSSFIATMIMLAINFGPSFWTVAGAIAGAALLGRLVTN